MTQLNQLAPGFRVTSSSSNYKIDDSLGFLRLGLCFLDDSLASPARSDNIDLILPTDHFAKQQKFKLKLKPKCKDI